MTKFDDLPEILKVDEAAAFLRFSPTGTRALIRQGKIDAIRVGRKVLVPKQALLKLMAGRDD